MKSFFDFLNEGNRPDDEFAPEPHPDDRLAAEEEAIRKLQASQHASWRKSSELMTPDQIKAMARNWRIKHGFAKPDDPLP